MNQKSRHENILFCGDVTTNEFTGCVVGALVKGSFACSIGFVDCARCGVTLASVANFRNKKDH